VFEATVVEELEEVDWVVVVAIEGVVGIWAGIYEACPLTIVVLVWVVVVIVPLTHFPFERINPSRLEHVLHAIPLSP
jgi:hypothetical protein